MSSQQLNALGPEELEQHASQTWLAALETVEVTPADEGRGQRFARFNARGERGAAVKRAQDAWVLAREALRADSARTASEWQNARPRAKAIANLNILHRQQMMGDWSDDINEAYIQDRIYETRPDVIKAKKDKEAQMIKAKKETKEHMGSMLGDWDKAGKIIKRHTSKNRKKTKRRKQKIAKRIKGTKRR